MACDSSAAASRRHGIFRAIGLWVLLLLLGAPLVLQSPIVAQGADGHQVYYVAPDGDCGGQTPCFGSIQAAVDAVDHGQDMIKVAAGVYSGVTVREALTQVVRINKDLVLAGGYTKTNWATPNPGANPTVINAQDQGRALVISGAQVTLQGLTITGGNATRGGGKDAFDRELGGGIYAQSANLTLQDVHIVGNKASIGQDTIGVGGGLAAMHSTLNMADCWVENNMAGDTTLGQGGGLWLYMTRTALERVTFQNNTASRIAEGRGGGVYGDFSALTVNNSLFKENKGGRAGTRWATVGGAGVYLTNAEATFRNNTFQDNVGNVSPGLVDGVGGAIYLASVVPARKAILSENVFVGNRGGMGGFGFGGAVSITGYSAIVTDNRFQGNIGAGANGAGGALHIGLDIGEATSQITITHNVFVDNVAAQTFTGSGGALYLGALYDIGRDMAKSVLVQNNTFQNNTGSVAGYGAGGAITVGANAANVILADNEIVGNVAGRSVYESRGGGIFFVGSKASVRHNSITGNTASTEGIGHGGGIAIFRAIVDLERNHIANNHANVVATGHGGGVWSAGVPVEPNKTPTVLPVSLTNNMIVRNEASTAGSGLWFGNGKGNATLKHNTIADNGIASGIGQGIWAAKDYLVTAVNSILAGHSNTAIYADTGALLEVNRTLFDGNALLEDGPGTVTLTGIFVGNPSFVNPSAGDYRIKSDSAAINKGINAGVTVDIDGQTRPQGGGYDLGADEYMYVTPTPSPTPSPTLTPSPTFTPSPTPSLSYLYLPLSLRGK